MVVDARDPLFYRCPDLEVMHFLPAWNSTWHRIPDSYLLKDSSWHRHMLKKLMSIKK